VLIHFYFASSGLAYSSSQCVRCPLPRYCSYCTPSSNFANLRVDSVVNSTLLIAFSEGVALKTVALTCLEAI